MAKRKQLSKKIRLEVFKRDKFTCCYCGSSAPEVILHVDHIEPVSKGGTNDIVNLVTSCADCNLGKSNNLLSDDSAVKKSKAVMDDLQERKTQLEMMHDWKKSLLDIDDQKCDMIIRFWNDKVGYNVNDCGRKSIKKIARDNEITDIMDAIVIATDQYIEYDDNGESTHESAQKAFSKIAPILAVKKREKEEPHLKDMYYIRGIMRNRFNYVNERMVMPLLKKAIACGYSIESIKEFTKNASHWTHWKDEIEGCINKSEVDDDG